MKKLFFILLSIQLLFASTAEELTSGEVIGKTTTEKGKQYFKITVPKNKSVHVNLTELRADIYLYVKKGNNVRFRFNDCYSSRDDSSTQECILTNDGETSVYSILVYSTETSLYNIKATIEKAEEIQVLSNETIQDAVEYKKSKQYQIPVKKGKITTVTLSDLSADADLRVKLGRKAALNTFDCKSSNGGTKVDECKITPKKDGTLFIQVYGYREASYSLKATQVAEENKLITKAKEHCQGAFRNESKNIVCSDKNRDFVFLIENDIRSYETTSYLYLINIKEGQESIKEIDSSYGAVAGSFIKLENTSLVAAILPHTHNDTINFYNLSGKNIFTLNNIINHEGGLSAMKTIQNGSKIIIDYWENGSRPDYIRINHQDTYKIIDSSNIKLINHI